MESIQIEVTQEDIDKGKQGSCQACPVALAWHRVKVLGRTPMIFSGDTRLPASVFDFVKRFDAGLPVEPFTFIMEWDGVRNLLTA